MSLLADRKIGTEELVMLWKQHVGAEEKVSVDVLKTILKDLCRLKEVPYDEATVDKARVKLNAPAEVDFEQFRVMFATALKQSSMDLTESLAVDALEQSQNK